MKKLTLLFILISTFSAKSQITVDYPFERCVFQRNNSNAANVNVAAFSSIQLISVEARVTNLVSNAVGSWFLLQSNPSNGNIKGTISNLAGGWYKLELRGTKPDNSFTSISTVNKFGVGEVFVIAGQSNSQGLPNYGGVGAVDDRVNAINFNYECFQNDPPFPVFSQLDYFSDISNWGFGPWCYGQLGDLLANHMNVPILFFNAGCGGTSIENWYASMQGQSTIHNFLCTPYCGGNGSPYGVLKKVLQYYVPITGVRAILWHQGESDNFNSSCGVTLPSSITYKNKLKAVIDQSRIDAGHTLPWVIARVSYAPTVDTAFPAPDWNTSDDFGGQPGTRQEVIGGQNLMITDPTTAQIYSGPQTDNIPRDPTVDRIHFINSSNVNSLSLLANAWYLSIVTNGVLINNNPLLASSIKNLQVDCIGGILKAEADNSYSAYTWVQGNNSISSPFDPTTSNVNFDLTLNNNYRVYMKEANGRTFLSNRVYLPPSTAASQPIISATPTSPAVGQQVTLTANNCNGKVSWVIDDGVSPIYTPIGQHINPLVQNPTVRTIYIAECSILDNCANSSNPQVICSNSIIVNVNQTGGTKKYEANLTINSNAKLLFNGSNQTNVEFDASKSILLTPGFEVQKGSVFNTRLEGCGNN